MQLFKPKDKTQEPGEITKIQLPNCKTWLTLQHFTNVQLLLKLSKETVSLTVIHSSVAPPRSFLRKNIQVRTLQGPYCICSEPAYLTAQGPRAAEVAT